MVMNRPVAPPALARREEDAHELLGLEQRARHVAVAPHGAVVAVEAARVRHEDAQQRRLPSARPLDCTVRRLSGRSAPTSVACRSRGGRGMVRVATGHALAVTGGERHQQRDLRVEIQVRGHLILPSSAHPKLPE